MGTVTHAPKLHFFGGKSFDWHIPLYCATFFQPLSYRLLVASMIMGFIVILLLIFVSVISCVIAGLSP